MIEFDPEKDRINRAKHGISLAAAEEMVVIKVSPDPFPGEVRLRAYGTIAGLKFCLVYVEREGRLRAISLRRAHAKEYDRHVPRH